MCERALAHRASIMGCRTIGAERCSREICRAEAGRIAAGPSRVAVAKRRTRAAPTKPRRPNPTSPPPARPRRRPQRSLSRRTPQKPAEKTWLPALAISASMTTPIRISSERPAHARRRFLRRDAELLASRRRADERSAVARSRDLRELVLPGGVLDDWRAGGLGAFSNRGSTTTLEQERIWPTLLAVSGRRGDRSGCFWARRRESFAAICSGPCNAAPSGWESALSAD